MNRRLYGERGHDRTPVAISVVIHLVAIALIASITFRVPLSAFLHPDRDRTPTERVQYVTMQPRARGSLGDGTPPKQAPRKAVHPAALLAPTVIPTSLPPIPPPSASPGALSGTGAGAGGSPNGVATGVAPALPDSRIELRPNNLRLPLTAAQQNDSAVQATFMAYREAEVAAEAHRGRSPRDWTFGSEGHKYGVDSQWVYLGKFKLPSAILAALPLNHGGVDGNRIIQARNAAWIRDDINRHADGLSGDDFRAAVKRIRERKDRERKEAKEAKEAAAKAAAKAAASGVP